MGKKFRVWIDESMVSVLERIKNEVANSLKKQYNLDEVEINGNIISRIAAARLKGNTLFNFKIKKSGRNRGVLELL